jgi:hypothetical protein
MRSARRYLVFLVLILTLTVESSSAHLQAKRESRKLTLSDARTLLLGKKIVIMGKTSDRPPLKGYLHDWSLVFERDGQFRKDSSRILDYLPADYQGKEALVVAVQLNSLEKERTGVGGVNALGEVTTDTSIVNPYTDVVVKLGDGTLAMTTSYLSLFFSESGISRPFRLLSERNDRAALIGSQLSSLIGKRTYAVAYSHLYLPTATLESMTAISRYSPQQALEFPRLQPLTILVAMYNEEKDVIILKLKDESGGEYLTVSQFDARQDEKKSFLEAVVESYPASLRSSTTDFTPREIAAIQKGTIYSGMSDSALYSTIGFPEKKNDWGSGGKQLIYFSGKLYVYLDASDHVKNWQSLDR